MKRREFIKLSSVLGTASVAAPSIFLGGCASKPPPGSGEVSVTPTVCDICFWKCAAHVYNENGRPWKIIGNPNDPPKLDPAWLQWNNGAIPKLANEMYTDPQTGDYARLRRYLKSAGCDDRTFLDHCSSRHSHVVGCWLLDVLVGVHWPKRRPQEAK